MSNLIRPRPPSSDLPPEIEALEALIEEARQRTRRRRRGYAAGALAAAAAGLIGFYGFDGGDTSRPQPPAEQPTAGTALAAQGEWRAAPGFEGGRITALALDPRQPTTVFAATLRGGVFKSSDGGSSWRALDFGPSLNRFDALAIAPQDPRTIYAGTGAGIFKSTDGGATWRAVNSGLFRHVSAGDRQHHRVEGFATALTVDPTNPEVVYAVGWGRARGVLKTTSGGARWKRLGLRVTMIGPVVVDPQDPDTLYAGAAEGEFASPRDRHRKSGVFRSSNGGETWHPIGLQGTNVWALALDPRRPDTIYAATERRGVMRSTDGGASWRSAGLEGRFVRGLMLHPSKSGSVYAFSDRQVFMSSDGGDAWHVLGAEWGQDVWTNALALDPHAPQTLYAGVSGGAGAGLFKSSDGGDSWRAMNAGLTDARVSAIAADPRTPGTAYAAIDERGVFKRVNGRWQAATGGLTSEGAQSVTVDAHHPATVYAGTHDGLFKSTNGGAGWRALSTAPFGEAAVVSLAADPQNRGTLYAITAGDIFYDRRQAFESRLYKSSDGGVTWPMSADVHDLEAAGTPDEVVARTVQESPLVIDPLQPDTLYAGGLGVRKSVDGGRTWRSAGLTRTTVLALAIDPRSPATVYAGTDAGLFTSTDAGTSWQASDGPLAGARVKSVAVDPRGNGTVYAGTGKGVFWTAGDGDGWHRFPDLPQRSFDALAIDAAAGIVYAGSHGTGLFELELDP